MSKTARHPFSVFSLLVITIVVITKFQHCIFLTSLDWCEYKHDLFSLILQTNCNVFNSKRHWKQALVKLMYSVIQKESARIFVWQVLLLGAEPDATFVVTELPKYWLIDKKKRRIT